MRLLHDISSQVHWSRIAKLKSKETTEFYVLLLVLLLYRVIKMYVHRLLVWDFLLLHVLLMAETWYGSLTVKYLRKVAAWMKEYRIAAFFLCSEMRLVAMSVFLVERTYSWRKPFIGVNRFVKITLYIALVKCLLDVRYTMSSHVRSVRWYFHCHADFCFR